VQTNNKKLHNNTKNIEMASIPKKYFILNQSKIVIKKKELKTNTDLLINKNAEISNILKNTKK
jgi:hypothetical protein